ncbi:bel12-ag transposon polyprotein [Lasius niger]|uniref:Bel12-ag transposon polyprotein n=1 Tax=Lasius niger TaxID=67767 RepID=A0A0J7KJY9_LASNI|nr:bel12-ag transposon polyprotein [Lasius niger]
MEMEQLIDAQHEVHGRISRCVENLKKIKSAKVSMDTINAATRLLDNKWNKFEEQHEQLQAEFWREIKEHDYTKEDFPSEVEQTYLNQRAELAELAKKLNEQTEPERATTPRKSLPRIQLPQFSGKFEDWPSFRDLFGSIVVGDKSLSKVEQLHYLKTCVKGDAEQLIRNLPATEDNFERAWDTLSSHFENTRFLVKSYLASFTSLPRMKAPSASGLRRIFHGVLLTVGALESIGRPISNCSDLFVHLVVELLDSKTRREWENSLGKSSAPPTYDELREFLQEQLMTQEVLHTISPDSSSKGSEKPNRSTRASHVGSKGPDPNRSCPLCKKDHFIAYCDTYKKKTAQEKREIVGTHQRCWNCLGRHLLGECSSSKVCGRCSGKHHTSLHDAFAVVALPEVAPSSTSAVHVAKRPLAGSGAVLLATARVLVTDRVGAHHVVRALVDPGSETSLIAESLAQRLRLPRTPSSVAIFGVGGVQTGCSRGRVTVSVLSRSGDFSLAVSPLVLPRLSIYGGASDGESRSWSHVTGLLLADPEFHLQDPVELLLGAEVYSSLVLPDLRRGGPTEPIAQQTRLGWVLLGSVGVYHAMTPVTSLQCSAVADLSDLVRRFWETEEPPRAPIPLTADEAECEEHFQRTHVRLADGRYQVRLPVRTGLPDLTSTRRAAFRLLEVMTRRFARDSAFGERYRVFMSEYLALGHMSPVGAATANPGAAVCYLPHHGVLRGPGPEAKIRVVFNGSSRTMDGSSLNASLHVGPNLLPALADILTRWRRHRYVFVADVEKMYRQIAVHPADRDLQRILWGEEAKLEYRLNTVTYGLASAPYLAIRVLRQLADDEETRFPLAADTLRRNIYMDDILTGADDLMAGQQLARQVSALCMAGGFPLRKWAASHEALLEDVPLEHRLHSTIDAQLPSADHSVLGLRWNPTDDSFALSIQRTQPTTPTKRSVLSRTARLFDPLGWLAPLIIRAKLLVQTAWLQHLDWDVPLAAREAAAWTTLEEELPLLEGIRLPRWFGYDGTASTLELHGFSDASELAYAAVIYLRASRGTTTTISLVAARTKVAPLKRVSLPRLELCAAHLVAKLAEHIRAILDLRPAAVHLWTDSTVALGWVRGHPAKWSTFIANRVSEIQRSTPEATWRHVPGRENPADCASRGVSPKELLEHPLWWQGPRYLREKQTAWPTDPGFIDEDSLPERRPTRCLAAVQEREPEELLRFSSLRRLLRVSAWLWRWRRCRLRAAAGEHAAAVLDPEELEAALVRWIRVTQNLSFRAELRDIRAGRPLPGRSPLRKLAPMIDAENILRVGGRLKHSLLDVDQRHPIILPSDSHLTYLVIDAGHRRTLHGGTQSTLASIRQRFWIPRARQLVRRHIHRCLPCVRWRAAAPQPMMGDLPKERVAPSRPFQHTGVDLAGPVWLRTTRGRGHKAYKRFLVIFVCFSSRAVHLEVASDYSAEAFLAAFRRFVSRRGLCTAVYSDCGTNFVGADRQLRDLFRAASRDIHTIVGRLADDGIRWSFNPPSAPHFGGLWEAAVKSVKHHLRRTIGESKLTFEELTTFLAEVEACLNSRPLQALSDDPEDIGALTPGHFLVGAPLNAVPEPSLLDVSTNRLSRWRLLQQMRDHLWQRWVQEYLQGLCPRPKWWSTRGAIQEGQLCLVRGESTPPCRWPLARITRLHPGPDGQVRVVDVRTSVGELTRPVVKIVPLPSATDADPGPPA